MTARIDPPKLRTCERCNRRELWNDADVCWTVDGDAVGTVHCVHEWDITGTYSPISTE